MKPYRSYKMASHKCVGLVYDKRVELHRMGLEVDYPERPLRTRAVWDILQDSQISDRCVRVPARLASIEELETTHTREHVQNVMTSEELECTEEKKFHMLDDDTYVSLGSSVASRLTVGGLINLCDKVVTGVLKNGASVMRPPGHHAEKDRAMGFCLFNNVAVAANVIRRRYDHVNRILIVDWDIHHGNGTQKIFYDDKDIVYFSIHRGDDGFYPGTGAHDEVGGKDARGSNVNLSIPCDHLGDDEFLESFQRLFLPIAREFRPDLIIVSAGFDAAQGDPLGNCCVTPKGFAQLTTLLKQVSPKIVLALEGGYNCSVIAQCMKHCVEILLDDGIRDNPPGFETELSNSPRLTKRNIKRRTKFREALRVALLAQKSFWQCLGGKSSLIRPECALQRSYDSVYVDETPKAAKKSDSIENDVIEALLDLKSWRQRSTSPYGNGWGPQTERLSPKMAMGMSMLVQNRIRRRPRAFILNRSGRPCITWQ